MPIPSETQERDMTRLCMWPSMPYLDADEPPSGGAGSNGDGEETPPAGGETPPAGTGEKPATWEDFLKGQTETIQNLYNEHTQGLRSALNDERQQRRNLETKLRELSSQLEKGSEAKKKVDELTQQLEAENRRADFYEDAAASGVANFRLAWLAIQDRPDEYLDRRGRVNFDLLKERNPELFKSTKTTPVPGHPGSGTQTQPAGQQLTMNEIIRGGSRGDLGT